MSRCCCGCFGSSPAGPISVPLPSQLPVHRLDPQTPPGRRAKEKCKRGEAVPLLRAERSDSTAAHQAPWACRKLPQEAHGLACPGRCRTACVLLPCREATTPFYECHHCNEDRVCFLIADLFLPVKLHGTIRISRLVVNLNICLSP